MAIDYCFGCAPVPGLVADPVERNRSVIRESMASISERSGRIDELGCLFELAGTGDEAAVSDGFDEPATGVFFSAPVDAPPAGAVDDAPAGVLPVVGAGAVADVVSSDVVSPAADFGPGPGDA